MNESILFYVSGHGFGHARRMTQVIRALQHRLPDIPIHVRSAAPRRIFEPLSPQFIERCDIDAGLAERDPLTIDLDASLNRLDLFMARRGSILNDEIAAVQRIKPRLIVADIPFLAGNVATEAGVPCVGISNFTWDWIYENLFAGDPHYARFADSIADGYARMSAVLHLPFGKICPTIRQKISMPLIAMKSNRAPEDVLIQLGIPRHDLRKRVLFGTRGKLSLETLSNAASNAPEFLFLCPHEPQASLPANALSVSLSPTLDFSDVLRISDIVVSKLGYGIISECIATQTRLVWPRREGFIEDAIVAEQAPEFLPMQQISTADFHAGNWRPFLNNVIALPPSAQTRPTNGAEHCAEFLANFSL